jgi:hypothetical protein
LAERREGQPLLCAVCTDDRRDPQRLPGATRLDPARKRNQTEIISAQ